MPTPAPLDLEALSPDDLKRLVVELLLRVAAQEDEIRALREENAHLKSLPKRPKLAPGGMDKATEPDKRAKVKAARRQKRKARTGPRTPPATEERTLTVAVPPGSRHKGYETYTIQDLVLVPKVIRYRRERWRTPDGQEIVAPLPPEVSSQLALLRFALPSASVPAWCASSSCSTSRGRSRPSVCSPSFGRWGCASPRARSSRC